MLILNKVYSKGNKFICTFTDLETKEITYTSHRRGETSVIDGKTNTNWYFNDLRNKIGYAWKNNRLVKTNAMIINTFDIDKQSIWVYDFEVLPKWWCMVAKDINTKEVKVITTRNELEEFKPDILIGYNNKHFDQHIYRAIMQHIDPYAMTKWIIEDKQKAFDFGGYNGFSNVPIQFDCSEFTAQMLGLKKVAGNMGLNIKESNVDFKKENLTEEDKKELIEYCKSDVDCTLAVFEATKSSLWEIKLQILEEFNLPLSYLSKTFASLSAESLGAMKQHNTSDVLNLPDVHVTKDVFDVFRDKKYDEIESTNVEIHDVKHKLGSGGLHGARNRYIAHSSDYGKLLHIDVSSYYPSIMINYDLLSRNCVRKDAYKDIYQTRMKLKAEGNPKQNAYKLILNTTFGASKDKFNHLYDPQRAIEVTVHGQLLLIDLLQRFDSDYELIQSNTDGIIIKTMDVEGIKKTVKEWEEKYNFNMDVTEIKFIVQRDVNNYLIEQENGKIKTKGSLFTNNKIINNNMACIGKAIVNKLVYGISISDTLKQLHREDFQIIVNIGSTFSHLTLNGAILDQKVNRTFITKHGLKGLTKVKPDGSKYRYPSMFDLKLTVDNENNKELELDLDAYRDIILTKLNDFTGGGIYND